MTSAPDSTTTMMHHHHTTTGGGHNHMDMCGMMTGHFCWTDTPDMTLIPWAPTNWWQYLLANIVIVFVTIFYEWLNTIRIQKEAEPSVSGELDHPLLSGEKEYSVQNARRQVKFHWLQHLGKTGLHVVQLFLAYCLMLLFMTYNIGYCLSVLAGAGIGYFFFARERVESARAHDVAGCH